MAGTSRGRGGLHHSQRGQMVPGAVSQDLDAGLSSATNSRFSVGLWAIPGYVRSSFFFCEEAGLD